MIEDQVSVARKKLLFVVTEDWYFCSHRLGLAAAAQRAGFEVSVLTRVAAHGPTIRAAGVRLIESTLNRRSRSAFGELREIWRLIRLYRRERPDIVHHVAMKPVLYGSIAAFFSGASVVNALGGLGHIYSSHCLKARAMRAVIGVALRLTLGGTKRRLILQNPEDRKVLLRANLVRPENVRLIRGAGVDLEEFSPRAEQPGIPIVALAARLLWSKGVGEFVAAARLLNNTGAQARFVLVGDVDEDSPDSIRREQVEEWAASGEVEWWGHCADMPLVFSRSHVVCLPSYYGEGVPKSLIEAAASGKPIVTTDWPGCREIVRDGDNGFLVPPRSVAALVEAIGRLLSEPELRQRMGSRGRYIAEAEFSLESVVQDTLSVYRELPC